MINFLMNVFLSELNIRIYCGSNIRVAQNRLSTPFLLDHQSMIDAFPEEIKVCISELVCNQVCGLLDSINYVPVYHCDACGR